MSRELADMMGGVFGIGMGLFMILYFRYIIEASTRHSDWIWNRTLGRLFRIKNPWSRPSYVRFGKLLSMIAGIALIGLGVSGLISGLLRE